MPGLSFLYYCRSMMSKGSKGNGFSEANGTKVKVSAAREDKLIKSYSTTQHAPGWCTVAGKEERCSLIHCECCDHILFCLHQ